MPRVSMFRLVLVGRDHAPRNIQDQVNSMGTATVEQQVHEVCGINTNVISKHVLAVVL